MLLREVMTRNPVCCKPTDTIDEVATLMLDHDCGEIPVCDGTKLAGVITDRDITLRVVAMKRDAATVPVSEVMTRTVFTIDADATLGEALALMEETLVRRLPVVDVERKIVGIVSQADLIAKVPSFKVARVMKSVSKKTRHHAVATV